MNTKKISTFLFITLVVQLAACSSEPAKELEKTFNSSFGTRISDSGLKHFELRYSRHASLEPKSPRSYATGRPRDPEKAKQRVLKQMKKHASELIEANNYCRSGYWVIDFDRDLKGVFLRGECNELATNDDRTTYPDTISNW